MLAAQIGWRKPGLSPTDTNLEPVTSPCVPQFPGVQFTPVFVTVSVKPECETAFAKLL